MAELHLGPTVRDDDENESYQRLPRLMYADVVDGANVKECASYRGAEAHVGPPRKQMRNVDDETHEHERRTPRPEEWVSKFPRSNRKF